MDVVGVLERDHDRRLTGIQIELERSLARVAKKALLECLADPGPRDERAPSAGVRDTSQSIPRRTAWG